MNTQAQISEKSMHVCERTVPKRYTVLETPSSFGSQPSNLMSSGKLLLTGVIVDF